MKILNTLAFKPFGIILDGLGVKDESPMRAFDKTETFNVFISDQNDVFECYTHSPVALKVVEGVPQIVVLMDKNPDAPYSFLLDRAVVLNPGVVFGLRAVQGYCTVCFERVKNAHCEKLNILLQGDRDTMRNNLFIDNIYTLFYQEKGKDFDFKGERHEFWELTYVDFGNMRTTVDDHEYVLSQGKAMLYGPGQYHMQKTDGSTFINFITISFDMKMTKEDEEAMKNRVFSVGNDQAEIIKNILAENRIAQPYYETMIINELKRFIIGLIRMIILDQRVSSLNSMAKKHVESDVVKRAQTYIHENLGKDIKIDDIARYANLSKPHLSAIFKKLTSVTPNEYMINARLTKGKELIRDGKLNITEIAEVLGYSSIHYFSRQFKKRYGVSPSEYSNSINY
jgi:AraC-like DNA-binding protein